MPPKSKIHPSKNISHSSARRNNSTTVEPLHVDLWRSAATCTPGYDFHVQQSIERVRTSVIALNVSGIKTSRLSKPWRSSLWPCSTAAGNLCSIHLYISLLSLYQRLSSWKVLFILHHVMNRIKLKNIYYIIYI